MELLAPLVERRSQARLRQTPLRRRGAYIHSAASRPARAERRHAATHSTDIARLLELNLDRYPSKAAMLTFLQSLLYAAEGNDMGAWQQAYVHALRQAIDVLEESPGPTEAVATLQGYRAFMHARAAGRLHVAAYT